MSADNQARYLAPEECAAQTTWRSVTGPWVVLPELEPVPAEEQARLDSELDICHDVLGRGWWRDPSFRWLASLAALTARWQDWRGKAGRHAGL